MRLWPLGKGPFTKRDFIDLISYRRVADDTFLMVDVGVPNAFGPCEGCVRGAVVQFGYVCRRIPVPPSSSDDAPSWCDVTMVNQTITGGNLPTTAANMVAGKILMSYMREYEAAAIAARRDGRMAGLMSMWGGANADVRPL